MAGLGLLDLVVQFFPFAIKVLPFFLVLLDSELGASTRGHLEGFFEGVGIYLLQNSLEGNEGLLQDLVPVVVGQVHDHRDQHGEGLVLVGLEDVQKVVILEEAHRSIGNLEMDSANALHDSLEQTRNEPVYLLDFTHFKYLL